MEILWWFILGGLIGALIGKFKGRVALGLFLGVLFGPIGWIIVALLSNERPKCPECGGIVVEGARKCKNCGTVLVTEGQAG